MRRPSKIKGFAVNLFDIGQSLVHLLLALYLALWGMIFLLRKDQTPEDKRTKTPDQQTRSGIAKQKEGSKATHSKHQ